MRQSAIALFLLSLHLAVPGSVSAVPETTSPVFVSLAKAQSRDKVFERCVYLDRKIEEYTQRRRTGGSNQQMASWRRSRERYEQEFHQLRCRKFSAQLRRKKR